jgi:hypothetical protein
MWKQEVPQKLVSLLRALHNTIKIKFFVDEVEQTMESITGVKQGDIPGPDLFIFFVVKVLKTWRSCYSYSYKLCTVRRNKLEFQLTRRRLTAKGEIYLEVTC